MLDWKSIKERAQKISADVSAIADEISASAKDFVADAKVKADETLVEVKSAHCVHKSAFFTSFNLN